MTARRSYSRHGLNVLKARVKVRGLAAIDRRTAAARALIAFRDQLLADKGGPDAVSAAEMALIEQAARLRLYVEHLDAWLMEQKTLINKRSRSVWPVLRERAALGDALVRVLVQLGLERRARRIDSYVTGVLEREKSSSGRRG